MGDGVATAVVTGATVLACGQATTRLFHDGAGANDARSTARRHGGRGLTAWSQEQRRRPGADDSGGAGVAWPGPVLSFQGAGTKLRLEVL